MTLELIPLAQPVSASVEVPGSKSYTNRTLVLAALSKGSIIITNPLSSDDTKAMISCLKTLGITIHETQQRIEVLGSVDDITNRTYHLDADLSGTTMRFLLALSCIVPGIKILKGKEGLNKRPIKDLVDALRSRGAHIEYMEKEGFPPVKITSQKLSEGVFTLKGDVSSQYFSALLMIAPRIGDVTITVLGEQISKPYIDMTIDSMKTGGVHVQNNNYKSYHIPKNQMYATKMYKVEGDYSSAAYFFAIAALTKSTITVTNLNPESHQADKKLLDILFQMGNDIQYGTQQVTVVGKSIQAETIDMISFPDQAQTLAVLSAFAQGQTTLTGIQSLRLKETERVQACQNELLKMGIQTQSTDNTLTIFGGNPNSATIETYFDHRMAMSFAVAGSILSGMKINNPEVVTKTFPTFWKKLEEIGIGVKEL